ncbi:thiopeptide-type bacteriocin biosynthesis protein [Streptomyces sp. SAI-170]|uniref:thiopeptide-type bacteriocin biosynthesis protein n=1 Tax=Streptomyces sp. SAI-170 TaxID=3377729 RepID=UPI003C79D38F
MTFDDDEKLPITYDTTWWHATVAFPGGAVSPETAQVLSAALHDQRFHFLRKDSGLRLRTERPAAGLLDRLVADQQITGWANSIYEPETEAFGGPEAMDVAHDLFCADSRSALPETGSPGTRERCVMLLSTTIREAGLDPFEAGDVWSQLAAVRPPVLPPTGIALDRSLSAMRRLMNADAARRPDAEAGWTHRVTAFADTGRRLRQLAADGRLIRGLRAILAHHAIFAFNRAGTPVTEQAATAWLGRQVAFSTTADAPVSTRRSVSPDPNLARMETTVTPANDPAELRESLANRLEESGHLRTPAVIDAFRTTDRHDFLPGVDLNSAYKEDAVPIKHDEHGEMIACISAPSIVATQLEQLDAQPGHKVLEAGAATGYNASLLGKLVGPSGQVWTLDVDQDLVDGASKNLHGTALSVHSSSGSGVQLSVGPGRAACPAMAIASRFGDDGRWHGPARLVRRPAYRVPPAHCSGCSVGGVRCPTGADHRWRAVRRLPAVVGRGCDPGRPIAHRASPVHACSHPPPSAVA